jgi:hypothetical protein
LHQIHVEIKYLPYAGWEEKISTQAAPLGIVTVNDPGMSVQAQYHGVAFEGGRHNGHPVLILDMGGGFIAAAGSIQPDNPPAIQNV